MPVPVPSWPAYAHLSPRRLGKDDAGVIQVNGAGAAPRAPRVPVPGYRAQGEFEARRGGGVGRGGLEDGSVDGPGGGGEVDRVMGLPRGLV